MPRSSLTENVIILEYSNINASSSCSSLPARSFPPDAFDTFCGAEARNGLLVGLAYSPARWPPMLAALAFQLGWMLLFA